MTVYRAKRIFLESFPVVTVSVLIEMYAGSMLGANREVLVTVPALLMVLPALSSLAGDFGIIAGARLSSALHLGLIEPRVKGSKVLWDNLLAVLILGILSSIYLAVASHIISTILMIETVGFFNMLFVTFVSGSMSTLTVLGVAVVGSVISYSRGVDPDNTVVPITTTIADLAGIFFFFTAARLVVG